MHMGQGLPHLFVVETNEKKKLQWDGTMQIAGHKHRENTTAICKGQKGRVASL